MLPYGAKEKGGDSGSLAWVIYRTKPTWWFYWGLECGPFGGIFWGLPPGPQLSGPRSEIPCIGLPCHSASLQKRREVNHTHLMKKGWKACTETKYSTTCHINCIFCGITHWLTTFLLCSGIFNIISRSIFMENKFSKSNLGLPDILSVFGFFFLNSARHKTFFNLWFFNI